VAESWVGMITGVPAPSAPAREEALFWRRASPYHRSHLHPYRPDQTCCPERALLTAGLGTVRTARPPLGSAPSLRRGLLGMRTGTNIGFVRVLQYTFI
jgi:hypothetical protein